jgi:hypothetical protein
MPGSKKADLRNLDMGDDKSVQIGDHADIRGSAIGNRASINRGSRARAAAILAVIGTIVIGWITNLIYDWTSYLFHFFGRK